MKSVEFRHGMTCAASIAAELAGRFAIEAVKLPDKEYIEVNAQSDGALKAAKAILEKAKEE